LARTVEVKKWYRRTAPNRGARALMRGGHLVNFGVGTGPFAIDGSPEPSRSSNAIGFRCAR